MEESKDTTGVHYPQANLSQATAQEASMLLGRSMHIDKSLLNRTTIGDGLGQAGLYELLSNEGIDKKAFLSYYVRRQVMNDVKGRCKSPGSKRIIREAQEEQEELHDKTMNGTMIEQAQANSDTAYLRAKTEVMVNHEEHRYRMEPKNVYKTRSIVSYHWSPKKRREMQRRVNRVTEPIENQTLDEVWETIKQRKEGKMDVSNILSGMNITRTYQDIVEDSVDEERKVVRSSPPKKSPKKSPRKAKKVGSARKKKTVQTGPQVTTYTATVSSPSKAQHQMASPPRASPPRASPPRAAPSGLTQQNLDQKDWSFYADNEVLDKELELGRDLIAKAAEKVTKEYLEALGANSTLTDADKGLVDIFYRLLDLVADGESESASWDANAERMRKNANGAVHKMRNYPVIVQSQSIKGHDSVKEDFIAASGQEGITVEIMEPMREFLCEAFCMIDIVEELLGAQSRNGGAKGDVNSLSAEKHREREEQFHGERSSLPAFPSPAPDTSNIGIDSQFVSPIPNRGGQDLGGQSVNKYIDVTQEHNHTNITKSSPSKKRASPKRQHNLLVAQEHCEELDRSVSPSRDLVKSIHKKERSSQKKKSKKAVRSPTKRLEQMKNAHVRNGQKIAHRSDTHDKMLYTVSPGQAYLVKREYTPTMDGNDMHQVEKDIAGRIDDYVKHNKEYLGKSQATMDQSTRVQHTHDELKDIHGAPTRVVTTEVTRTVHVPAGAEVNTSQYSDVLKDMELEASRISEQITGGRVAHASDSIQQTYEDGR